MYLIQSSIAVLQGVTTGSRQGDEIIIEEGLSEGDRVVVKGINSVYQGMKMQ